MKKTAAILVVLTLAMSLAACGDRGTANTTTKETTKETTTQATTAKEKTTKETTKEESTEESSAEKRTTAGEESSFDEGNFGDDMTDDGLLGTDTDNTARDGVDISDTDDRNESKGVLDEIGDDIRDGMTGTETR